MARIFDQLESLKDMYSFENMNTEDYNIHVFQNNRRNPVYVTLRKQMAKLSVQLIENEAKMAKASGINTPFFSHYDMAEFSKNHDESWFDSSITNGSLFFVISDKTNTKAYAMAKGYQINNDDANGLGIGWLVVDEKQRKNGYSQILLDAVTQFGKDHEYSFLCLSVQEGNTPAKAAYNKNGFIAGYVDMYKDLE